MIEKLDIIPGANYPGGPVKALQDKLNELIDEYNDHFHDVLDTHFNISYPKYEGADDAS